MHNLKNYITNIGNKKRVHYLHVDNNGVYHLVACNDRHEYRYFVFETEEGKLSLQVVLNAVIECGDKIIEN